MQKSTEDLLTPASLLEDSFGEFKYKSIDFEDKIYNFLKDKRLQQINKEHKATNERFKDITEKVSKKYGTLATSLKGFN